MATPNAAPSERTRVRRLPDRARYDAESLAAIVDAAWIAHVAFPLDGGVHSIPTAVWREGDHLYIHGAKASRMLKALTEAECCVSLAILDGLVLARSAFHHSMNFRSVVVYGRFEIVDDAAHKAAARPQRDLLLASYMQPPLAFSFFVVDDNLYFVPPKRKNDRQL